MVTVDILVATISTSTIKAELKKYTGYTSSPRHSQVIDLGINSFRILPWIKATESTRWSYISISFIKLPHNVAGSL